MVTCYIAAGIHSPRSRSLQTDHMQCSVARCATDVTRAAAASEQAGFAAENYRTHDYIRRCTKPLAVAGLNLDSPLPADAASTLVALIGQIECRNFDVPAQLARGDHPSRPPLAMLFLAPAPPRLLLVNPKPARPILPVIQYPAWTTIHYLPN
jgi:hypothetical protein